jgi:hypothetical protein
MQAPDEEDRRCVAPCHPPPLLGNRLPRMSCSHPRLLLFLASNPTMTHHEVDTERGEGEPVMAIKTIGLLSPGDIGHSIGHVLHSNGLRVLTCLEGRSERSRELAARAGIEDGGSLEDVVQEADLFISVLVPSSALSVAKSVATALHATGSSVLYVDCNAVSPMTVRAVADIVTEAGSSVADAGIIGPPPRKPGTKFYVSGRGPHGSANWGRMDSTCVC